MIMRTSFGNSTPLSLLAAVLLSGGLIACEGDQGPAGPQGPEGPRGEAGDTGSNGGVDPSLSTIDKAYAGVGGKDAVTAMTSFTVEATTNDLVIGEGPSAEDGSIDVATATMTATHDLAGSAFRLEYAPRQYFFIPGERTFIEVVKDNLGYVEGVDNIFAPPPADGEAQPQAAMSSDRMAALRKSQRLLNPHYYLADAVADASIVSEGGFALVDGVPHEILVVADAVADIRLFVNSNTGLITKLETVENDVLRRDVPVEVFYSDWRGDAGQVKFPNVVLMAFDGELIHAQTRSAVTVNGTVDSTLFDIPTLDTAPVFDAELATRGMEEHRFLLQFAALGIRQEGVQLTVTPVALEDGDDAGDSIYHLTGGSHHSLAVKQAGGVVIIEAPLYPERSEAILDWVEDEFGAGTQVTHVIATHHHFDHTGGLRAFVAAGATVVVQENSRDFFAEVFRAPSTVKPDALADNPVPAKFLVVGDDGEILLDDANFPVGAYHIPSAHSDDMLIASVGSAGDDFVFVSDIYSPGQPPLLPGAAEETLNGITAFGLTPDTIVGGHGVDAGGPLSDLEDLVNPPALQ